jgi:hypothetical protein
MICLFEVILSGGADGHAIFSEEVRRETMLQVMTLSEAQSVGFRGLSGDAERTRYVAVHQKDAGWIEKALERSPEVAGYRILQVVDGEG